MEGGNGNDDEEPQICTVFSSTPSSQSKTIFDTIAFSIPKKESGATATASTSTPAEEGSAPGPAPAPSAPKSLEIAGATSTVTVTGAPANIPQADSSVSAVPLIEANATTPIPRPHNYDESPIPPAASLFESLSMSYIASDPSPVSAVPPGPGQGLPSPFPAPASNQMMPPMMSMDPLNASGQVAAVPLAEAPREGITEENLKLLSKEIEGLSLTSTDTTGEGEAEDSPLPTANTLFINAPEVPFPVGVGSSNVPPPTFTTPAPSLTPETVVGFGVTAPVVMPENPVDVFSKATYSSADVAYDAWIPSDQTRQILANIATGGNAGINFPDKSNMTTPGIIYKEDLVDKVAVNMSRIFGEVEANKRQILTADSVTQDDNGIRELIKLGCYRSAINLTKRILTLYGQGPGKMGQFSKHTPHSLQLWMTRVALLVRIREFKIAESELEAFKDFQNPDMYYEYYQNLYGEGRKGSMVPFHFRLIAAEIPQYSAKDYNKSANTLNQLLLTVQQILKNINEGICEDGSPFPLNQERQETSLQIWKRREVRVYMSLVNAFILAKDFPNSLRCLTILREKDSERRPQYTSAIGRLFLQFGDLPTSQKYFKEAATLRSSGTEVERVENLIDASLYFIAQGVYPDAFGLLKEALAIQPDNFMITNNMAVCLLYMGKVKESLALMETTVRNNTPQLLQENVILNLSTIYELENSDGLKKNALLKLISEYKGDGINLASLKMPNLI